jgi:OFA family oxalate/formate antiporter-like MFS transporter
VSTDQRIANRWIIVGGALLLQLCLGILYSWSVFVKPVQALLGIKTASDVQLTFTIAVVFFALAMIPAGRLQDRYGPRIIGMIGAGLLGIAFLLTSFLSKDLGLPYVYLTYGVLGGIGMGFGYVTPIAACVKWFPDKRGLVTGLAVAGFGFSSVIFGRVAPTLIKTYGIKQTFTILGVVLLVAGLIGAGILRNPPVGYKPAGWAPPARVTASGAAARLEFDWRHMIRTNQFYLLFAMYALGASAGLLLISVASPFATKDLKIDAETAGWGVAAIGVFNGAGRIIVGWISDALGRVQTMRLDFIVAAVAMLLLYPVSKAGGFAAMVFMFGIVALTYGALLAMFPATTADFWGTKNLGINYSLVFLAWGLAGVIGPQAGARFLDIFGNYYTGFITAAVLAAIAFGLTFVTKKPTEKELEAAVAGAQPALVR